MRSSSKTDRRPPARELTGLALLALAVAIFEGELEPLGGSLALPLASAALGTWVLARRVGAGRAGAALAAAGFAATWATGAHGGPTDPLAHLPWGLVALEACARAPGAARLALVVVAWLLLFGAAPPGQRGALALAAGAFALAEPTAGRARRLAALAIGALLGVAVSPEGRGSLWPPGTPAPLDVLGSGLGLVCLGALGLQGARGRSWRGCSWSGQGLALLVALAALGAALERGFALDRALGLVPGGAGAPVASVLVGFALAAALGGARGAVGLTGAVAWGVAAGFPGARELWGRLPLLGLTDPAALSVPAALLLGLTAARGLAELAPRPRHAAALLLAAAIGLALLRPSPAPASDVPLDVPDEVVAWELDAGPARDDAALVTGRIDAGLPVERARVLLFPLHDTEAQPVELAVRLGEPAPVDDRHDARAFHVARGAVPPGRWLIALSLERSAGGGAYESLGIRRLGVLEVPRAGRGRGARLALAALAVLLLLVSRPRLRGWAAAALALAQ